MPRPWHPVRLDENSAEAIIAAARGYSDNWYCGTELYCSYDVDSDDDQEGAPVLCPDDEASMTCSEASQPTSMFDRCDACSETANGQQAVGAHGTCQWGCKDHSSPNTARTGCGCNDGWREEDWAVTRSTINTTYYTINEFPGLSLPTLIDGIQTTKFNFERKTHLFVQFDELFGLRNTCPGRPGRLSALRISHSKSSFYGAFVWARRALNI
jgi:hypothetical protein